MRGRRSIAVWFGLGLSAALNGGCSGAVANVPSAPAQMRPEPSAGLPEPSNCRFVRASACRPTGVLAAPPDGQLAPCGAENAALVEDLVACLKTAGGSCDLAGRLAVASLRSCAERILVEQASETDEGSLRSARRFVETWVESAQPFLSVGPLGLGPSPMLAREMAADALLSGNRELAGAWLRSGLSRESEEAAVAACLWAIETDDLTSPPSSLAGTGTATSTAANWSTCRLR